MQRGAVKDTVSLRLPEGTKKRIEFLAKATRRTKTFVMEEAINTYLSLNEWQIKGILEGLEEVKTRDTTPHESVLAKWEARACE